MCKHGGGGGEFLDIVAEICFSRNSSPFMWDIKLAITDSYKYSPEG